ncbi:DEHA2D11000p [Debaryomyces hansenii CBS767]|uniref:Mediator of RNA polymerase II transcription subunit 1 n=1 Tax=Debaryomyces hansenii (strain ATCC 36239 / CBS 767 / BCRC 21394 / JCM 1990 / NBRC 0083 / IGC 2968) TaxID=284592 RepID=Q6BS77_DEBHA|nr:DEHA2D11000p [Debaryomyces hansenii CBS767]CAG87104.2 DEHA2D11000p [Debaryomyces hansenii CBS767]|eukprot:XP_458943.2 DEHA2D11000p [Debaryomyces hansenii CBS767]
MSSFNDSLDDCLVTLYDYSSNFYINVELIQKLAQHLKLDTFVDKDAYSHIFEPTKSSERVKFQRLSIAGSFILIDIDFTEINKIIKVSLSLANHIDETNGNIPNFDLKSHVTIGEKDEQGNMLVEIDSTENKLTFLTKGNQEAEPSADDILLSSLQAEKLGKFPFNLKFLATLDRLSSTDEDLFLYLDKTAVILQTAYLLETKHNEDWLYTEGLYTSVGKISTNDPKSSQLGVFIDFWNDFRYINHEYTTSDSSTLLMGNSYKGFLNIKASNSTQKDYLLQNKESIWKLVGRDEVIESYKLAFNDGPQPKAPSTATSSIKSSNKNNSNWILSLDLNYPVFVHLQVLEFLGITDYEKSNEKIIDSDLFDKLNDSNEYNYNSGINKDSPSKLHITQQISQEYIPLTSVSLNSLTNLIQLIPLFRNYIVLANLLRTLIKETASNPFIFVGINGVSTRAGEMSTETKNRLKASLKLPDDVTDEELMGLSAVSDNSAFSTAQINKPNTVDLTSFMNDGLSEVEKPPASIEDSYISFSLDDIDYCSSTYDLLISIDGLLVNSKDELVDFEVKFKISNGVMSKIKPDDQEDVNMDDDNESIDKNEKFIKGLNVTEDIIKVLKYVYLD